MVRGEVDGELPVNFVVDTGGEVISISTGYGDGAGHATELHAADSPEGVRDVGLGSRRVPDARRQPGVHDILFTNFPVVVLNLRRRACCSASRWAASSATSSSSQYRVGIDLDRSVLRLKAFGPPSVRVGD